jgi:hypothetical protein
VAFGLKHTGNWNDQALPGALTFLPDDSEAGKWKGLLSILKI